MTESDTNTRRHNDLVVPGAAIATGVLGALTLILAQRQLDLVAFAPLAQLWTIWAVLAAGLTFSFQQWAAIHDVGRRSLLPGASGQRLLWSVLGLGVALLVVTSVARQTVFQSDSMVWPLAASTLPIGTALNGVRRGQLARHTRPLGLAAVIAGENAIRLAVTVGLIIVDAEAEWFALALLAGFAVVLGPTGGKATRISSGGGDGFGTLGAAATAGFLAYAFMFGSPILLAVAGGDAEQVSALFLVLTGVRMPFVVLQAVVPQLAVKLAAAADPATAIASVRRRVVVVWVGGVAVASTLGYLFGDLIIGGVFGIRGDVEPMVYAMLAAASVTSACALVATVTLVVEGRSRRIALAWGVPALSALVVTWSGLIADTFWLATWLLIAHATVALLALGPQPSAASPSSGSSQRPTP